MKDTLPVPGYGALDELYSMVYPHAFRDLILYKGSRPESGAGDYRECKM